MDSQPDPARPARSRLTLHPAEALKLPGVDAEHEPKPEGPESTPSKTVDDLETASVAINNSEHAPALAEPKQRKAKAKEPKDALISNPPKLPEDMAKRAKQQAQSFVDTPAGVVEVNLDDQHKLKKQLEADAKEEAEQKKQAAWDKKQIAAKKALEKAEKKLKDAQAKAAQLQSKASGKTTKRKLDPVFASVAEPGQSAPL